MKVSIDQQQVNESLVRGVDEVIEYEHLKKKLLSGKQLRIKLGIDPTGSDLHIGHAVQLRKLRQFQKMGHQVILVIGDYTAMIGDPTGRNETRPMLAPEDIKANEKTYIQQAATVIDMDNVELRHNSEWYGDKTASFMMELTGKITVARVLDRDDFQKRLKEGSDIQMQEILYPLLQGYDSVMLKADVEIGGTDQKFNLLMGRKLQKRYNQPEQDVMTLPLLEGIDGEKKMSKTYNNYIALLDSPEDMFGKTMSIPDNLIIKYFELATTVPMDRVEAYKKQMEAGENPRDVKFELAYALTELYHGKKGAERGKKHFSTVIQSKEKPDKIPEVKPGSYDLITVLVEGGLVGSRSEARRAIEQGGVKVNGRKVETQYFASVQEQNIASAQDSHGSASVQLQPGDIVQKGKRFFVKVI